MNGGTLFSNYWEGGGGISFAGVLIMLCVDILIYLLIAVYLDRVLPSKYFSLVSSISQKHNNVLVLDYHGLKKTNCDVSKSMLKTIAKNVLFRMM